MTPVDLSEDPYGVACPDCQAEAQQPCRYRPVRGVDPDFVRYRSAKVQARVALTGTPTKRPHLGRIDAMRVLAYKKMAKARREALTAAGRAAEASPLRRQIARVEAEYDRREYEQLRAWLAANARILITQE